MAFDYNGSALRVKVDTKTILHEIDFSYSESTDFEELASKDVDKVNIFSRLIKSLNYLIWGDV